ncbi:sulfotransferase family 2 domain-containing protein [Synechococcus sp. A15-24]|uniref:sulfotransferase family 2 domain-containing protein n=1 Tax=Synechococcus sp. A15-24 TaxID=1050635 RepID=UPI0016440357|nr:sulfotransferase family 2 domain-containing protein [Synechococcus sp. A15-24]QNJ27885.1 carbohydrate sulfotransferase 8-10 family protein [Synechococcus sp. A15-24]
MESFPLPQTKIKMPINQFHNSQKNILYSPEHKITFISNPKVACSTIKNSMLGGFDGNVHSEAEKRFGLPPNLDHDFFCITRNPFSRALSCFKNKIGPNKEINPSAVWHPFCKRFGFEKDKQPTFCDFLRALLNDPNPETMDMHYRCQHFNLHHSDITPRYTARIEHFNDLAHYLRSHNIWIKEKNAHKTGALISYINDINKQEEKLIRRFYMQDFIIYGYDEKLKTKKYPEPLFQEQKVSLRYRESFSNLNKIN